MNTLSRLRSIAQSGVIDNTHFPFLADECREIQAELDKLQAEWDELTERVTYQRTLIELLEESLISHKKKEEDNGGIV